MKSLKFDQLNLSWLVSFAFYTYYIIDWQTQFTWLWRWLPLRLSKHQSPTTVRCRTKLTRTITLYEPPWYSWVEAINYAILCLFVCSFTERSVVLHFRWTNQSCTLDMLIDKKSEGFKNIEVKLANEVELLILSRRLLDYLLYALAYGVFSKWLC